MSSMNPALKDFWLTKSRYKILYGGRASSKSWDTAAHAIRCSRERKLKFLCVRQFQANIKESVYTLLKDQIYRFGVQDEFTILHNTIIHNETKSEFIFFGMARNTAEVKSTEGVDVCWIEESAELTKDQWDIIEPTIRKQGSEIWTVFNPAHRSDFVWQEFVEREKPDSIVRKINFNENPFLSETMLKVIEQAKIDDYEEYEHIYEGKVREGDDKALFTYDEIERAMNGDLEHCDKSGVFSYAVDVARYGNDKSVRTKRRGYHIYDMKIYKKYSTMELANQVNSDYIAEEHRKPDAMFIDTIGVGAGVYDRLREKGRICEEANASMKADKVDLYYNKRAEMYFNLRDFIRKGGKIPDDAELKEELLAIRYVHANANGKILIQPKDDIKELIGRSPDKSDSVALHFFSEVRIERENVMEKQMKQFRSKLNQRGRR